MTRSVADGLAIGLSAARPALAHLAGGYETGDSLALGGGRQNFFCHEVFQRGVVEHRVGQKALQLGALVLKLLEPLGLGHLHPAELGLPGVERRRADPMLAADLGGLKPGPCSRRTAMICSSVDLDRFIVQSILQTGL